MEGHVHDVMRILIQLLLVCSLLIYSLGGTTYLLMTIICVGLAAEARSFNKHLSVCGLDAPGIGRHSSLVKSDVAAAACRVRQLSSQIRVFIFL